MKRVTIKEVFDKNFLDVNFDNTLINDIFKYRLDYLNIKRINLEFFGGNSIGVQPIRYTDKYILEFFNNVLLINYFNLRKDFLTISSIDNNWKVGGDVFNHSIFYISHRILVDKKLNKQKKALGLRNVIKLFFYRTMAALIANSFKYNANPDIVHTAYNNLSNKYLIKKLGTWNKVIDYRVDKILDKNGIHYKTLVDYKNDKDIVYLITDSQGRIKDTFKKYYSLIVETKEEGLYVIKDSNTIKDIEGEVKIKDKINKVDSHLNYIVKILHDPNSFVNKEIIDIIIQTNYSSTYSTLEKVLIKISENHVDKRIIKFTELVIIEGFYIINKKKELKENDYGTILITLKGGFTSSRNNTKNIKELRKLGESIVKKYLPKKSGHGLISSIRTSIMLFIFLRCLIGLRRI